MDWSEQTIQAMNHCVSCPRRCGADRANGQIGVCGAGMNPSVARAMPHLFEEPCISGTNGSGTIFFRGCSMHCVFCQNDEISHDAKGAGLSLDALCETLAGLIRRGVHNLSFVTPTHYAYQIADALRALQPNLPVVWNTGGYERVEMIDMLAPLVDVWLPDLKFADQTVAARCSSAADYADYAFPAVKRMAELSGKPQYGEDGLMTHGLLIRHLCLPGMTGQSKRILTWIRDNLGTDMPVSLMRQYLPAGAAKEKDIRPLNRRLRDDEYERVFDYMMNLGLTNGFTQEAASAETGYVPAFNGEGVIQENLQGEQTA